MQPRGIELEAVPLGVEKHRSEHFASRATQVAAFGPPVQAAVRHLERFVLGGGKRIRPTYGWAGFVGGGGLAGSAGR